MKKLFGWLFLISPLVVGVLFPCARIVTLYVYGWVCVYVWLWLRETRNFPQGFPKASCFVLLISAGFVLLMFLRENP